MKCAVDDWWPVEDRCLLIWWFGPLFCTSSMLIWWDIEKYIRYQASWYLRLYICILGNAHTCKGNILIYFSHVNHNSKYCLHSFQCVPNMQMIYNENHTIKHSVVPIPTACVCYNSVKEAMPRKSWLFWEDASVGLTYRTAPFFPVSGMLNNFGEWVMTQWMS